MAATDTDKGQPPGESVYTSAQAPGPSTVPLRKLSNRQSELASSGSKYRRCVHYTRARMYVHDQLQDLATHIRLALDWLAKECRIC